MYDYRTKKEKEFEIDLNTPYIHYKNKKPYSPIGWTNIQENGEWVAAVRYIAMYAENDDDYTRSVSEFKQKFKKD